VFLSGADDDLGEVRGYRRILAPVDCSRRSEWGASIAASIARASGAELLLTTVVPTPELLGDAVEWSEQARVARLLSELNRETAGSHLERLGRRLGTGELTVRSRIMEDSDVGRALCRLEEEEDVSLVVIAAHGHTGDPGWRYGSTAMRLLDNARRPLAVFQDLPEAGGRPTGGELRRRRARGARSG
jgi:nucleotide-binding universal stress UspA family protein